MQVNFKKFELKLKHTFTISRESHDVQPTLIVELTDGLHTGLGEATSNPYYGITLNKMEESLNNILLDINRGNGFLPEKFWEKMYPLLSDNMFALCALDIAYNDLFTKRIGQKLYQYWGLSIHNNPKTNYTIAIDTIEKMVSKLKEFPSPIYKIKLGTPNDIEIVKELRKHTDAIFRVDANCGWSVNQTIKNAIELKKLGVEFIEQPLKADNWEGHKEVFKNAVLPIIADESCQIEEDIEKCYNHFHGVNVKLVKCGGVTPAKRMLEKASGLGMKTMVGCMTESTVGISAIAHLLPLLDYVDMDGALLLSEDIATGVTIKNGVAIYADANGTGASLL